MAEPGAEDLLRRLAPQVLGALVRRYGHFDAAEDALQQLDWAIGYLHGIRKTEISRALAKNRSHIRTRLLGQDAQPDPSAQTDET